MPESRLPYLRFYLALDHAHTHITKPLGSTIIKLKQSTGNVLQVFHTTYMHEPRNVNKNDLPRSRNRGQEDKATSRQAKNKHK